MRKLLLLFAFYLSVSLQGNCQKKNIDDWTKLIDANKCEEANQLCTAFVDSTITVEKAEAQKCLSNVVLCGHDIIQLQGDDVGGGTMSGGFTPEAVGQALVHLNLGIKLAPQDLSIHQGRLHIMEVATRYSDMVKALDESCDIYKGKDALEAWLAYAPELYDLRQYQVGLDFMKVLDKHYPNNPDIIGNIGAFLSSLKKSMNLFLICKKQFSLPQAIPSTHGIWVEHMIILAKLILRTLGIKRVFLSIRIPIGANKVHAYMPFS